MFAFSTENWKRPEHEVDNLMQLLEHSIVNNRAAMQAQGVRLVAIGQKERLSPKLQQLIADAAEDCNNSDQVCLHLDVLWTISILVLYYHALPSSCLLPITSTLPSTMQCAGQFV
jgi:undecaprenyl diphosphate synthase